LLLKQLLLLQNGLGRMALRMIEPKKDRPSKLGSRYHELMNSDQEQATSFDAVRYAVFDRLPRADLARLREQARKAAEAMASDLCQESKTTRDERFEGQS
jgi:hypothetical protein